MTYPILVTGAYGFIGSKFVKYLNGKGIDDIIVSDYLTNGKQFDSLNGCRFKKYVHPSDINPSLVSQVFHFGAVSDTACWDGDLVMKRNTQFTIDLIDVCRSNQVPISYSSSASVYGNGNGPLNLYAYSKWLVDEHVRQLNSPHVQGFRYFNVYATDDSERHKGDQASPYYKFKQQALSTGQIELFDGSENFKRDFVHVDRVCEVQFEMSLRKWPGIFDIGCATQKSFRDVAEEVGAEYGYSRIVQIPFPRHLEGHYQTNTLASMDYYY